MSAKIPEENQLKLKISEAYTRDVGRGIVRINYDSMATLSASAGDVIEIKGKRRTVAKCLPLLASDEIKKIIRADRYIRNNSGANVDEIVNLQRVKAFPAIQVTVQPLEQLPPIDERYLVDALESIPMIKGDIVMVPYFGGRLTFQVSEIMPADKVVLVTLNTIFKISSNLSI